jgi:hypothetical protein
MFNMRVLLPGYTCVILQVWLILRRWLVAISRIPGIFTSTLSRFIHACLSPV